MRKNKLLTTSGFLTKFQWEEATENQNDRVKLKLRVKWQNRRLRRPTKDGKTLKRSLNAQSRKIDL